MNLVRDTHNNLARQILLCLQEYLLYLGYRPVVHIEFEGCCVPPKNARGGIDFPLFNQQLTRLGIKGRLKPEYWRHQWEYVSDFAGQTPLEEADYVQQFLSNVDRLFYQQGMENVLVKPVVWSGDRAKLAQGSKTLFLNTGRDVHIPNAVQLNVSLLDNSSTNLVANTVFGEHLQNRLMATSGNCSLIFLPEEEAFERFRLKSDYGLEQELCSPVDISGGSHGSIALYRERGKHDQRMGEETVFFNPDHSPLLVNYDWQKTARVEHRLGASSRHYNPYLNIIFALLNMLDAIDLFTGENASSAGEAISNPELPVSLLDRSAEPGAISLFHRDSWFASAINNRIRQSQHGGLAAVRGLHSNVGDQLKQQVLACYQPEIVMSS